MTPQEMFDTAFIGMIKQGTQSRTNGKCKYRAADGKKCAAGFLIPDEVYDPEMDSDFECSITEVAERFAFETKLPHLTRNPRLIIEMQQVHDNYDHSAHRFRRRL